MILIFRLNCFGGGGGLVVTIFLGGIYSSSSSTLSVSGSGSGSGALALALRASGSGSGSGFGFDFSFGSGFAFISFSFLSSIIASTASSLFFSFSIFPYSFPLSFVLFQIS